MKLIKYILLAARITIAKHWKQLVILLDYVKRKLNWIMSSDKLTHTLHNNAKKFDKIWDPWIRSISFRLLMGYGLTPFSSFLFIFYFFPSSFYSDFPSSFFVVYYGLYQVVFMALYGSIIDSFLSYTYRGIPVIPPSITSLIPSPPYPLILCIYFCTFLYLVEIQVIDKNSFVPGPLWLRVMFSIF